MRGRGEGEGGREGEREGGREEDHACTYRGLDCCGGLCHAPGAPIYSISNLQTFKVHMCEGLTFCILLYNGRGMLGYAHPLEEEEVNM